MKFYSEPNMLVTDSKTGDKLFSFDENGEFKTNDQALIKKLKIYFKYEDTKKNKEEV